MLESATKKCEMCEDDIYGPNMTFPDCGHTICETCMDGPFIVEKVCPIDNIAYQTVIIIDKKGTYKILEADNMIYEYLQKEITFYEQKADRFQIQTVNNDINKVKVTRNKLIDQTKSLMAFFESRLKRNLGNKATLPSTVDKAIDNIMYYVDSIRAWIQENDKNDTLIEETIEMMRESEFELVKIALNSTIQRLNVIRERYTSFHQILYKTYTTWKTIKISLVNSTKENTSKNFAYLQEQLSLESFHIEFLINKFIMTVKLYESFT